MEIDIKMMTEEAYRTLKKIMKRFIRWFAIIHLTVHG